MTVQGEWSAYLFSDGYLAKTLAGEVSYTWDRVINLFTENIIDGTGVAVLDLEPDTRLSEQGIRFMALEDRFSRRMLGESVVSAMKTAEAARHHTFARVITPTPGSANPNLAYVFLILAYPTELEAAGGLPGGYEQYRRTRAHESELLPTLGTIRTHHSLESLPDHETRCSTRTCRGSSKHI